MRTTLAAPGQEEYFNENDADLRMPRRHGVDSEQMLPRRDDAHRPSAVETHVHWLAVGVILDHNEECVAAAGLVDRQVIVALQMETQAAQSSTTKYSSVTRASPMAASAHSARGAANCSQSIACRE